MILIVDDQPDLCEPLRRMLSRAGFPARCVAHGRDALAALATETPELIILDVMMPDLSGFDVLKAMRDKGMNMPVIMYTASSSKDMRKRAAQLGANDFITKGSLEWPELLERIRGMIMTGGQDRTMPNSEFGFPAK